MSIFAENKIRHTKQEFLIDKFLQMYILIIKALFGFWGIFIIG